MRTKDVNNKNYYIVDYNKNTMCYYCYIEYDEGFSVGFRISVNKNNYTLNDETIIKLIKKSISKYRVPHIKNIRYSFVGRFKDGKYFK
jgi:hypothetical protein